MAGKKQQVEDPWSGFVDVLSNVVMVVTFLVIILGIAMFALSQQVAKSMAAEMMKAQETRTETQSQIVSENQEELETAPSPAMAEALEDLREEMAEQLSESEAARKRAEAASKAMSLELAALREERDQALSEGKNRVSRDRPLLQADEFEGNNDLTVRSRNIPEDFETIVASAEEVADDNGETVVERSDALLKVAYKPSQYKIDAATSEKIRTFLKEKISGETETIELRAFASSSIGSVSEARRVAYYRIMTVRGVAVAAGIDPKRVKIVLRESEQETDADSVWIFVKSE